MESDKIICIILLKIRCGWTTKLQFLLFLWGPCTVSSDLLLCQSPFLFLIPIETWVGELFAVQPGKHNFWNIQKHLRVCGEIKLTWCIPRKLGEGVLEEIRFRPSLPTFWISVSPSLSWARFWCSWGLVEEKCLVSCFRISWRSLLCLLTSGNPDMYTFIPRAVGSEPWACHWLKWTGIWQEIPSLQSDLLEFQGLYLELWGLSNQITVDNTQDFTELACLDGPNLGAEVCSVSFDDLFGPYVRLRHGQRGRAEKGRLWLY